MRPEGGTLTKGLSRLFGETGVVQGTATQLGGAIVGRVVLLGMMVLSAQRLGVEDFGRYAFVVAYLAFFRLAANLGMTPVLSRELARSPDGNWPLLRTAFSLKFVLAALAMTSSATIIRFGTSDERLVTACSLGALSLVSTIGEVHLAYFQSRNRMQMWAISETVQMLVWGGLGATFLLAGGDLFAVVIALVAGNFVQLLVLLIVGARSLQLRFRFDPIIARSLISNALPLAAMGIFSIVALRLDVILLYAIRGEAEVGLYAAAVRLAEPWVLVSTSFTAAIYPHLSVLYVRHADEFARVHQAGFKYLTAFILPIAVGGGLLSRDLLVLVYGATYAEASIPFAILLIAEVFLFVEIFNTYLLLASNLQWFASIFTITSGLIAVLANIALIPWLGVTGAAMASLIAYSSYFIIQSAFRRTAKFTISMALGSPRSLIAALAMGILLRYASLPLATALVVGPVTYLATLFVLGGIDRDELRLLFRSARPTAIAIRPPDEPVV